MSDWMFDDSYSLDDDEVVEARIAQARSRLFVITPQDRAVMDAELRKFQELHLKLAVWMLDQCLRKRPR
jgi:hypothetical protein